MIEGMMNQIKRRMREEDTDEETESVTSSSQVSTHRGQPLIWGDSKGNIKDNGGGPQKTRTILPRKDMLEMAVGDQEDIEVRGVGLDHLEEMELGPVAPIGPRGFPGRDGLSTTGGSLTSTGLGIPPTFNANLSTIGMENSFHYLGESLNHVMQFQQM